MNMIEKVARAIHNTVSQTPFEQCNQVYQKAYFIKARAAIEAMKEPNEAMLEAGDSSLYYTTNLYQSMIDAALK